MSKLFKTFSFSVVLAIVALAAGCDDRGTNVPEPADRDGGGPWPTIHAFSPQFRWQLFNTTEQLDLWVYIPQVAADPPLGESRPVPLLILLAPEWGNKFYYAQHGLKELLREMIADGTIQPMVVACIGNNPTYGGFFYAGGSNFENLPRPPSGNYDDIIGRDLILFLRNVLHIVDSPQKTGIGGVGMGAYGAFRAALIHDTAFGSITVTDGPLDFDGDQGANYGRGLEDLFLQALQEQNLVDGDIKNFDSSSAWPISSIFIGGAFAFSPHDTVIFDRNTIPSDTIQPIFVIDSSFVIDDSISQVDGVFFRAEKFDYHLPFTSDGNVYNPIWDNFWLTENLETLLSSSGNKLNGVNMWFGTTPETRFNFYEQTQSWINTLTGSPYNYSVVERKYEGMPGNAATHDQYLYDLLREMLTFHSQSFGN